MAKGLKPFFVLTSHIFVKINKLVALKHTCFQLLEMKQMSYPLQIMTASNTDSITLSSDFVRSLTLTNQVTC